ncbi:MAG: tRNA (adenosine(37)-N6)-threonylcarbamoyltransferase complex ATPase subunit type 1 TsaE [Candidatus Eremiobacteraeota bacterium]|nr:tRNA (adenosine(37)-N6)-threonylcarbamoyltransferase complex ATPase subunit type 1 TsaE [Candidatus Eremiobacteraeota bacterium]
MKRTFTTEAELAIFAGEFARRLQPGDVVALSGPLGSGKTTFIRAVVKERLGHDPTTSPTFTFRHRYEAQKTAQPAIEHLDFFRIRSASEVVELGLEEVFDGRSIVLVEWWEHAPQLLPSRRTEITVEGVGNGPRVFELQERS